jgi:hypothetical protein
LLSDDYSSSGVLFVGTPLGLLKSSDGGRTFRRLPLTTAAKAATTVTPMMALSPGYSEAGGVRTAYVAMYQFNNADTLDLRIGGGLYKTDDGGNSWAPLATSGLFAGGAQAVAVAPGGRIFAQYNDGKGSVGLVCSADGGSSWAATCPPIATAIERTATHSPSRTAEGSSLNWVLGGILTAAVALAGAAWLVRARRRQPLSLP